MMNKQELLDYYYTVGNANAQEQYDSALSKFKAEDEAKKSDNISSLGDNGDIDSADNWRIKGIDAPEVYHKIDNSYDTNNVTMSELRGNLTNDSGTGFAQNPRKKVYEQYSKMNNVPLEQAVLEVDQQANAIETSKESGYDLLKQINDGRKDGRLTADGFNDITSFDMYNKASGQNDWMKQDSIDNPDTAFATSGDNPTGETGAFGRALVNNKEFANRAIEAGWALPGSTDPKEFALQQKASEKARRLGVGMFSDETGRKIMDSAYETGHAYGEYTSGNGKDAISLDRALNIAKAPVAMVTRFAADTAEFVFEDVFGVDKDFIGNGDKRDDAINKFLGYDTSYSESHLRKIRNVVSRNVHKIKEDEKGWIDRAIEGYDGWGSETVKILNRIISNTDLSDGMEIIKQSVQSPETLIEFYGVLALEAAFSKGAGKLTSIGRKVNEINNMKNLTKAQKAAEIKKVTRIRGNTMGMANQATYMLATQSPMMLLAAGQAHRQEAEYIDRTGNTEGFTVSEKTGSVLLNYLGLKLDKAVDLAITKGGMGVSANPQAQKIGRMMNEYISKVPAPIAKSSIARMTAAGIKVTGRIGGAAAVETPQEAIQTGIEEFGKYNAIGSDAEKITNDQQAQAAMSIAEGGAAGFGMGAAMRGGREVYDGVAGKFRTKDDTNKDFEPAKATGAENVLSLDKVNLAQSQVLGKFESGEVKTADDYIKNLSDLKKVMYYKRQHGEDITDLVDVYKAKQKEQDALLVKEADNFKDNRLGASEEDKKIAKRMVSALTDIGYIDKAKVVGKKSGLNTAQVKKIIDRKKDLTTAETEFGMEDFASNIDIASISDGKEAEFAAGRAKAELVQKEKKMSEYDSGISEAEKKLNKKVSDLGNMKRDEAIKNIIKKGDDEIQTVTYSDGTTEEISILSMAKAEAANRAKGNKHISFAEYQEMIKDTPMARKEDIRKELVVMRRLAASAKVPLSSDSKSNMKKEVKALKEVEKSLLVGEESPLLEDINDYKNQDASNSFSAKKKTKDTLNRGIKKLEVEKKKLLALKNNHNKKIDGKNQKVFSSKDQKSLTEISKKLASAKKRANSIKIVDGRTYAEKVVDNIREANNKKEEKIKSLKKEVEAAKEHINNPANEGENTDGIAASVANNEAEIAKLEGEIEVSKSSGTRFAVESDKHNARKKKIDETDLGSKEQDLGTFADEVLGKDSIEVKKFVSALKKVKETIDNGISNDLEPQDIVEELKGSYEAFNEDVAASVAFEMKDSVYNNFDDNAALAEALTANEFSQEDLMSMANVATSKDFDSLVEDFKASPEVNAKRLRRLSGKMAYVKADSAARETSGAEINIKIDKENLDGISSALSGKIEELASMKQKFKAFLLIGDYDQDQFDFIEKKIKDFEASISSDESIKNMVANESRVDELYEREAKAGSKVLKEIGNRSVKPSSYIKVGTANKMDLPSKINLDNPDFKELRALAEKDAEALKKEHGESDTVFTVSEYSLIQDPGMWLVSEFDTNEKGKVSNHRFNLNAVLQMRVVLEEYVTTAGSALLNNDVDTSLSMAGLSEGSDPMKKMIAQQVFSDGAFLKNAAEQLGKSWMRSSGISVDFTKANEADKALPERIAASIGYKIIQLGISDGTFEAHDSKGGGKISVKDSESVFGKGSKAIPMLRIPGKTIKIRKARLDKHIKANSSKEMSDIFGNEFEKKKQRYSPPKTDRAEKIAGKNIKGNFFNVNQSEDDVSIASENFNAMVNDMKSAWTGNMDVIKEIASLNKTDLKLWKKRMGYTTEEEMSDMSFDDLDSAESVNLGIDRSWEAIEGFIEDYNMAKEANDGNEPTMELYFEEFMTRAGRTHINSNAINPQVDKLHRFIFSPKGSEGTYPVFYNNKDMSDDQAALHEALAKSIAQGFGFPIDKNLTQDSKKVGQNLMQLSQKEISELRKEMMTNGEVSTDESDIVKKVLKGSSVKKLEVEHFSHFVQSIQNIEAIARARVVGDKEVTITQTVEYDGVTNGVASKSVQFIPEIDDETSKDVYTKKLRAFGIFIGKDLGRSGIDETDGEDDSYEATVSDVSSEKPVLKKGNGENVDLMSDKTYKKFVDSKIFPEFGRDASGKIIKAARNFAKGPLMQTGYSAMIATVAKQSGFDLMDGLGTELMLIIRKKNELSIKKFNEFKDSMKFGAIYDMIDGQINLELLKNGGDKKKNQEVINKKLKSLAEKIKTRPFAEVKFSDFGLTMPHKDIKGNIVKGEFVGATADTSVLEYFANLATQSYGPSMAKALYKQYGHAFDANRRINNSFKTMSEALMVMMDSAIYSEKKRLGVEELNDEQEAEILAEIAYNFGPQMEGPAAGGKIEISDSEKGNIEGQQVQNVVNYKKYGQRGVTIQLIKKQIMAAKSSGSVLPIQYVDGATQARVINEAAAEGYGVGNIFDAIVVGAHLANNAQLKSNTAFGSIHLSYNMSDNVFKQLDKTLSAMTTTQREELNKRFKSKEFDVSIAPVNSDSNETPENFGKVIDYKKRAKMIITAEDVWSEMREYAARNTERKWAILNEGFSIDQFPFGKEGVAYFDKDMVRVAKENSDKYGDVAGKSLASGKTLGSAATPYKVQVTVRKQLDREAYREAIHNRKLSEVRTAIKGFVNAENHGELNDASEKILKSIEKVDKDGVVMFSAERIARYHDKLVSIDADFDKFVETIDKLKKDIIATNKIVINDLTTTDVKDLSAEAADFMSEFCKK